MVSTPSPATAASGRWTDGTPGGHYSIPFIRGNVIARSAT